MHYTELINDHGLDPEQAVQVVKELSHEPPVLPAHLYRLFVLERLVGLNKAEADLFLRRHGWGSA